MFIYSDLDGGGVRASLMGAIFEEERDELARCIDAADGGPIDLWLNSPGGDLSAAFAMRSLIENYAGSVTVHCSGVIASAATVLLCAKNAHVVGHRGSVFMIHAPSTWADGNSDDMKKAAEALDVITDELVSVYATRLNADEKAIRSMVKKETWLSLEKAAGLGLVDEVEAPMASVVEPALEPADPFSPQAVDALAERVSCLVSSAISCGHDDALRDETRSLVASLSDRLLALEKSVADTAGGLNRVSENVARAYAMDCGPLPVATYHDAPVQKSTFKLASSRSH